MTTTILVTGATGTIGSRLVKALAGKKDVAVRVGVRDPKKGEALTTGNVTAVALDWNKPETIAAALAGVDKAFLLTPFDDQSVRYGKSFADAAKAAGVSQLVKLSVIGSEQEPGILGGRWHREVEKYIQASGLTWTFLRPGFFMDNFIGYYPPDAEGAIYLPIGEGAVSWIDTRDIADVAAHVLTTEGHANKAYDLTGGAALTISQAAAEIGKVTGRNIRYVDVPESAAEGAMKGMGLPGWMVQVMMELHGICKAGYASGVSPAVGELLGRPPRTFAEFAKDYAAAWKPKA